MNIGLGRVNNYIFEKGFGFASNDLDIYSNDGIFFHTNSLGKSDSGLAESIESYPYPNGAQRDSVSAYLEREKYISESLSFWYEIREMNKGKQVKNIIKEHDLTTRFKGNLPYLTAQIKKIWMDLGDLVPEYFQRHCESLLGLEKIHELKNKRRKKINKVEENINEIVMLDLQELKYRINKGDVEEIIRSVSPRYLSNMKSLRADVLQNSFKHTLKRKVKVAKQRDIVEQQYDRLIKEFKPLEFTQSKELASFIRDNGIDRKFDGGLPHDIYRKVCHDLNIDIDEDREEHLTEFGCFKKGDLVEVIRGPKKGYRGKLQSYWRDTWSINCSGSSGLIVFSYPEHLWLQDENEERKYSAG